MGLGMPPTLLGTPQQATFRDAWSTPQLRPPASWRQQLPVCWALGHLCQLRGHTWETQLEGHPRPELRGVGRQTEAAPRGVRERPVEESWTTAFDQHSPSAK